MRDRCSSQGYFAYFTKKCEQIHNDEHAISRLILFNCPESLFGYGASDVAISIFYCGVCDEVVALSSSRHIGYDVSSLMSGGYVDEYFLYPKNIQGYKLSTSKMPKIANSFYYYELNEYCNGLFDYYS